MSVPTTTLAEFLVARIAEDEAAARAATPGPWVWDANYDGTSDPDPRWRVSTADGDDSVVEVAVMIDWQTDAGGCTSRGNAAHIAQHNPARVLAECESKRRVRSYQIADEVDRVLAAVYADHPDYRDEWRPTG